MTVDSTISPAKRRKVKGSSADVTDCAHDMDTTISKSEHKNNGDVSLGNHNDKNNSSSQLDRMEQMMMRMEEKLDTISSLESRCEHLERKCSSLESALQSTPQLVKDHIDNKFDSLFNILQNYCSNLSDKSDGKVEALHEKIDKAQKYHEYNTMILKNQTWKYPETGPLICHFLDDEETECIERAVDHLERETTKMRAGVFPNSFMGGANVSLPRCEDDGALYTNDALLPHLREFALALKEFTPAMHVLPDIDESSFTAKIQLNHEAKTLLKDALIGKPFVELIFQHHEPGGMSIDDICDIVDSNKNLRELSVALNRIRSDNAERLCSVIRNRTSLVNVDLRDSFDIENDPDAGNALLRSLLTGGELFLQQLRLQGANINSGASAVLSDFLATNPNLRVLDLDNNELDDSDAALIANALRSNSTLDTLYLEHNNITEIGFKSLLSALCSDGSLNAISDSNHCCSIINGLDPRFLFENSHDGIEVNRAAKIYSFLSAKHKQSSTVDYFSDVDLKILPNMLEAVYRYETICKNNDIGDVESLSIVYEVMRRWEKVFHLYESYGARG